VEGRHNDRVSSQHRVTVGPPSLGTSLRELSPLPDFLASVSSSVTCKSKQEQVHGKSSVHLNCGPQVIGGVGESSSLQVLQGKALENTECRAPACQRGSRGLLRTKAIPTGPIN
jgi:hypothetical protein